MRKRRSDLATVLLAARRLKAPGLDRLPVHHTFLLLRLDSGYPYAYSADKDHSRLLSPGDLLPYEDLYALGSRDWTTKPPWLRQLALEVDGLELRARWRQAIGEIEALALRYHALTMNCNVVVRTLADLAGLAVPPDVPWAPGLGRRILLPARV
jgi:hypothetical protein